MPILIAANQIELDAPTKFVRFAKRRLINCLVLLIRCVINWLSEFAGEWSNTLAMVA